MHCSKENVRILEFGMGIGLNVLLTFLYAQKGRRKVYFHTIEKYPLTKNELDFLDANEFSQNERRILFKIHECSWEKENLLNDSFSLFKEKSDFREASPVGLFDVIYFDAFSPDVQPNLWSPSVFENIYKLAAPGALLTTYSAKGEVKRNLMGAGFTIEKLPGPPGKREFIRARKCI